MGRSYLTVRALVLVVTFLVIVEYFSLMQSAENADKKMPVIFQLVEAGDKFGYNRHLLHMLDPDLFFTGVLPPSVIVQNTTPAKKGNVKRHSAKHSAGAGTGTNADLAPEKCSA